MESRRAYVQRRRHDNSQTFALVACSASKLDDPKRITKRTKRPPLARDLYIGDLFRKSVEYVETVLGCRWGIMSAGYGYREPDWETESYDTRLSELSPVQIEEWGAAVGTTAWWMCGCTGHVVLLGGRLYREPVIRWLEQAGTCTWSAPLAGLGIGEQKRWLLLRISEAAMKKSTPQGQLDLFEEVA